MISVPLAYKFVALAVMLSEINYCCGRLHLKENLPVTPQTISFCRIFDPTLIGFDGRIDTKEYSFCFVKSGRLRFITKLEGRGHQDMGLYRGGQTMEDFMQRAATIKSSINTNDACRLATNWLCAVQVDLGRLQSEKTLIVEQQQFNRGISGSAPVPIFYVKWGDPVEPTIDVMISGVSGELLNLRQEDDSYSKRPASLIKDMDKLLAIPDDDFLKYSSLERSNLVVRFGAVQYSPSLGLSASPETNAVSPAPQKRNAPAK